MLFKTTTECSNFCLFHGEDGWEEGIIHTAEGLNLFTAPSPCSKRWRREIGWGWDSGGLCGLAEYISGALLGQRQSICWVRGMEIQCSQGELLFIRKWKVFKVFTPQREEANKKTGKQGARKALEHRKGSIELFKLGVSNILFLSELFGYRVNPTHCRKPQSSQLRREDFSECFPLWVFGRECTSLCVYIMQGGWISSLLSGRE